MFALLIHIYYQDSWEKIFRDQLKSLEAYSPLVMVNLCMNTSGDPDIVSTIKKDFPGAIVITTPNIGKDIGGKLALIDFFLQTGQTSEFIIFLHDKLSPHSITADRWRNKLFRIINPDNIERILRDFRSNARLGIVGTKDFIKYEFDEKKNRMNTSNNDKIRMLIEKFNLNITDYTFIAGMMIWIRTEIIRKFFSAHSALSCREMLEEGDTTDQFEGTFTHSWERVFCWLANDQQYFLKGI